MMSHHVTCHVTAVSHTSSLSKRKSKGKENKINIKLEKLNKRKEKLLVSKVFHNIIQEIVIKLLSSGNVCMEVLSSFAT